MTFGPTPTVIEKICQKAHTQACYHYSSAIAKNPQWDTLKCQHGTVKAPEATYRPGPNAWRTQHHRSWRTGKVAEAFRDHDKCQVDEWPPRYFLTRNVSPELNNFGKQGGQLMRFLPAKENSNAGADFKSVCFRPHLEALGPTEFKKKWDASKAKKTPVKGKKVKSLQSSIELDATPSFRYSKFEHAANPLPDAGMWANPCWPKRAASKDPGFTLWAWDDWYSVNKPNPRFDFSKPYQKGGPNGD